MSVHKHSFVVTPDPKAPQNGVLRYGGRAFPCILGRSGVKAAKHEGDGATPVGTFPLRRVLYRADRITAPRTALPSAVIREDNGWCDDPADSAYNCFVKLPYAARAERLWRVDHLYDVIVVLGYNDDPVTSGKGSAIFMHIAADGGSPTEGCIALTPANLLEVLQDAGAGSTMEIQGLSA